MFFLLVISLLHKQNSTKTETERFFNITLIANDLRSFGCILFELVEFRRAFDGRTEYEVYKAILDTPIPQLNEPFLNSILNK